ncbi:unnamed protein product [Symbiodinium natans]|uniref:Uncharacterized protein n=1 Tax=Symbiodinium natans TaxID=878477 RepID=A0A812RUH0_9DINO|nr:unnamed protein product [Symbiodinium natans]
MLAPLFACTRKTARLRVRWPRRSTSTSRRHRQRTKAGTASVLLPSPLFASSTTASREMCQSWSSLTIQQSFVRCLRSQSCFFPLHSLLRAPTILGGQCSRHPQNKRRAKEKGRSKGQKPRQADLQDELRVARCRYGDHGCHGYPTGGVYENRGPRRYIP